MTVGQISRDQMALSSKTQRLSKPFHAAAQLENFGAGAGRSKAMARPISPDAPATKSIGSFKFISHVRDCPTLPNFTFNEYRLKELRCEKRVCGRLDCREGDSRTFGHVEQ